KPVKSLTRVLLPAPFSPHKARISPGEIAKSTALSTVLGPKRLVSPRVSRMETCSVVVGVLITHLVRREGKCCDRAWGCAAHHDSAAHGRPAHQAGGFLSPLPSLQQQPAGYLPT